MLSFLRSHLLPVDGANLVGVVPICIANDEGRLMTHACR